MSPPKWHLGHTTWFFEELILVPFLKGHKRYDERFPFLFNSYYKTAGRHWIQGERGFLSRPSVQEILKYRSYVEDGVRELLKAESLDPKIESLFRVGFQHEQQHQELLLMDIKYILGMNPLKPIYQRLSVPCCAPAISAWKSFEEGTVFDWE